MNLSYAWTNEFDFTNVMIMLLGRKTHKLYVMMFYVSFLVGHGDTIYSVSQKELTPMFGWTQF